MNKFITFFAFFIIAFPQPYTCEWQVIANGGSKTINSYQSLSTLGQLAIGKMINHNLFAFSGFWLPIFPSQPSIKEDEEIKNLPIITKLYQPFPNPFFSSAIITYSLEKEEDIKILIYSLNGSLVRILFNGKEKRGRYLIKWDGKDNKGKNVNKGIYFLRFITNNYQETKKIIKGD
jgi:hypothetical protein